MSKDDFFTHVVLSYRYLLSCFGKGAPGLREYCRVRHVSYRDFLLWASTNEIASGLLEVERLKKRLQKETGIISYCDNSFNGISLKAASPLSSIQPDMVKKPLLYPLPIISDTCDDHVTSAVVEFSNPACCIHPKSKRKAVLRGIRIAYPNGVKVSVREADSRAIYCLVHGEKM